MSLTLFAAPGSCSRVALTALAAAGLPAQVNWVDLAAGQQRQPDYLARNPKGKVPLLLTPEGALSDNLAIATWLDAQAPAAGLLPAGGFARAEAIGWLGWAAGTLHPLVYRLRMTGRIHPDAATHDALRAAARAEMAVALGAAEAALADGRPWLGGAHWSIADTYVAWAIGRAVMSGVELSATPRMAAFVARHDALPAWQQALSQETP